MLLHPSPDDWLMYEGKVISGCGNRRDTCFISAQDALTGKEAWKFIG
jgi:hypothetical protein